MSGWVSLVVLAWVFIPRDQQTGGLSIQGPSAVKGEIVFSSPGTEITMSPLIYEDNPVPANGLCFGACPRITRYGTDGGPSPVVRRSRIAPTVTHGAFYMCDHPLTRAYALGGSGCSFTPGRMWQGPQQSPNRARFHLDPPGLH